MIDGSMWHRLCHSGARMLLTGNTVTTRMEGEHARRGYPRPSMGQNSPPDLDGSLWWCSLAVHSAAQDRTLTTTASWYDDQSICSHSTMYVPACSHSTGKPACSLNCSRDVQCRTRPRMHNSRQQTYQIHRYEHMYRCMMLRLANSGWIGQSRREIPTDPLKTPGAHLILRCHTPHSCISKV